MSNYFSPFLLNAFDLKLAPKMSLSAQAVMQKFCPNLFLAYASSIMKKWIFSFL
jgi:hypothetical protein